MFSYNEKGIRMSGSELWLDAERKVDFSYVSHGHADHIKSHNKILATPATAKFFEKRRGRTDVTTLGFGESMDIDDMHIQLYPAGHVLGSSMIHIQKNGASLLYTGDFKMQQSWTAEAIEIPHADILIMESTFGSPDYRFNGNRESLVNELVRFVEDAHRWRTSPVVLAYALGKAQEAMKILGDCGYTTKVYVSAWELAQIYRNFGVKFKNCFLWDGGVLGYNEVLIVPPHVRKAKTIQRLSRQRTVMLSGWANNEKTKYRYGADDAIALSDHADFDELLEFVRQVAPQKVYCTHGLEDFPFYLRRIGYDAKLLKERDQLSLL